VNFNHILKLRILGCDRKAYEDTFKPMTSQEQWQQVDLGYKLKKTKTLFLCASTFEILEKLADD
jgi:hypothetical protein